MLTLNEIRLLPWAEKRKVSKENVLAILPENAAALAAAYEVGKWVWIEFEKKPDQSVLIFLKTLGFFWNKERKAWQHPCGVMSKRSEDDPTEKYQVKKLGA